MVKAIIRSTCRFVSGISLAVGVLFVLGVTACDLGNDSTTVTSATTAGVDQRTREIVKIATADVIVNAREEATYDLARLEISPPFLQVKPGEMVDLKVRTLDQDGQVVPYTDVIWSMTDIEGGAIDGAGVFRAGRISGTYVDAITVIVLHGQGVVAQRLSAHVTVVVDGEQLLPILSAVYIVPGSIEVVQGQVLKLDAIAVDEHGALIPDALFSWGMVDAALGHIDNRGMMRVNAPVGIYERVIEVEGEYDDRKIRAIGGITVLEAFPFTELMNVQILPTVVTLNPGDRFDFMAVALGKSGQQIPGVEFVWTMADQQAGHIDQQGRFLASEPGIYTDAIRVDATQTTGDGILINRAFAGVVIEKYNPRTLSFVDMIPKSAVLSPGDRILFSAFALDPGRHVTAGSSQTWRVIDDRVGVITDVGVFVASIEPGHYPNSIEVRVEKDEVVLYDTASVTIAGTLSKVRIVPETVEISAGDGVTVRGFGYDDNGVVLPGLRTQWEVLDPRAGTIDQLGNFTAGDDPGVYDAAIQVRFIQKEY